MKLRNSIFYHFVMVTFLMIFASGCSGPLVKYINDMGYSAYKLPRDDRGPGSVYRVVKGKHGKEIVEVCEKLLVNLPIKTAELTPLSDETLYTINNNNNIKLLPKFIKDIKVNSSSSFYKNIEIKLGNLKERKIVEEDFFDENAQEREIVGKCRRILRVLQQNNQFENVFMIYSTISTDDFEYKLQKLYKNDSSLSIPKIKKILGLNSDINITVENNQTLIIHEPRYIGFKARKIVEFKALPKKYKSVTVKSKNGWGNMVSKKILVESKDKIQMQNIENFDKFINN